MGVRGRRRARVVLGYRNICFHSTICWVVIFGRRAGNLRVVVTWFLIRLFLYSRAAKHIYLAVTQTKTTHTFGVWFKLMGRGRDGVYTAEQPYWGVRAAAGASSYATTTGVDCVWWVVGVACCCGLKYSGCRFNIAGCAATIICWSWKPSSSWIKRLLAGNGSWNETGMTAPGATAAGTTLAGACTTGAKVAGTTLAGACTVGAKVAGTTAVATRATAAVPPVAGIGSSRRGVDASSESGGASSAALF